MARRKSRTRDVASYEHRHEERANNPPAGLVTAGTDPDRGERRTYAYDPHLDPQLVWAGKAEHTSFDVPTVSLHVHERIDPLTIIEAVRREAEAPAPVPTQLSFFATPAENPPVREAIQFYRHRHGWTNRLVAGDSLLVMNSLLEKEGLGGKVQMVYIDPPYGIKYGSNFQPFVNRRSVRDGRDDDLTGEPEQVRAFRDTWELGLHSYLAYLRDRLLLARELLTDSGSCFVQISDVNVHHVRELMDEVFGAENFVSQIAFLKTTAKASVLLDSVYDMIIWYARSKPTLKSRTLYFEKIPGGEGTTQYVWEENVHTGQIGRGPQSELSGVAGDTGIRIFAADNLTSQSASSTTLVPFDHDGKTFHPGKGGWKSNTEGLTKLAQAGRLMPIGNSLMYKRYLDDFPVYSIGNMWRDTLMTGFSESKIYVVQTSQKAIQRCMLLATDPGDLIFDPTCGSGTTAYVAEQWGRRWITCDTSRVALALARQRLMTATYDYYQLAHPAEGVGSGFIYKTVPHVTLKSIANNPDIHEGMTREEIDAAIARHAPQETLYDQPLVDRGMARVSGPFTVEAVPSPAVRSVDEVLDPPTPVADDTLSRTGETLRQEEWRDELMRTGIRAKAGQMIRFARLEALPGCRWLHAVGETRPSDDGAGRVGEGASAYDPLRVVVSFGPEHAPLTGNQVEQALEEAQHLVPRPQMLVYAAFQFDPYAARDIDETQWPGVTLLKAKMADDLLVDDLKKKRASNESFWLIGQPDVEVVSVEWLVASGGQRIMRYERFKELSGVDSLAEIAGLGGGGVPSDAGATGQRKVRAGGSTAQGGRIDPLEYRRGAIAELHRRVSSGAGGGEGIAGGGRDTTFDHGSAGIPGGGAAASGAGRVRGDREDAERADALTALLALTPDHLPLTTRHYSQVTVRGFDYYNTHTGDLESGGADRIAVWMLDTDYDGRSLYPRQVFFPMAGAREGWARLARTLRAEIDEELIEAYRGTESLPFVPGPRRQIAVKIVDDRGIESLRILGVD